MFVSMMVPTLVFAGGIVVTLVVVLVALVLTLLLKRGPATAASEAPASPAPSSQDRQAVLERLARGDITRDQAEADLETPLPTTVAAPAPSRSGCGTGCLIAAVIAAVLIALLLLMASVVCGIKVVPHSWLGSEPNQPEMICMPASEYSGAQPEAITQTRK
jgi:hypothetical protein